MTSDAPRTEGLHHLLPGAVALHQAGRLTEATKIYETILAEAPEHFDALHLMGVIALQEGKFEEAQQRITAALKVEPDTAPALINLTAAYLRNRQFEEALQWGRRAAQAAPDSVDAVLNLGTVLHEMGRYDEAVAPLQHARSLTPNSTQVCNLLGSCLLKTGDPNGAVEAFEVATASSPNDSDSWANLATALNAIFENDRALECANKSVALRANSSNALAAHAASLLELGKVDEAIASYREAVKFSPSVQVLCAFANALITSGLNDEAADCLRRAVELDPTNPSARWILALSALKPVYETESEIQVARTKFSNLMNEIDEWFKVSANPIAYQAVGACQPFYLAYHEMNNRQLLMRYGDLCATWMTSLTPAPQPARNPLPRTSKMRIGIASGHIRDHSVWIAITKGWAQLLDKNRFELFVFCLHPQSDKETLSAKRAADFFDGEVKNVDGWIDSIKKANLDALIYPGVGMDAMTYQLAALRLAPLQAASWGHPETSGLPEMDFYLSGAAFEPADAQDNYSEKLVRLPNFGAFVEPLDPKVQDPNLKALGLPKDEPLLLCPGTPFKYLPTHDSVWLEIAKGLQANGSGRLVFFASSRGSMHFALITRLRKAFLAAGVEFDRHVAVIPVLDRPRFFGLMQKSTLLLDTLGFSGFNTALQGLECGLPVLAYEGKFMRGRLASGIMRTMGMPELVATSHQEFIRKALEFAADPRKLKKLRGEIPKRRKALFKDTTPIRALEDFLQTEIQKQRTRP